jgi:hypothetical protein
MLGQGSGDDAPPAIASFIASTIAVGHGFGAEAQHNAVDEGDKGRVG